MKVLVINCGSSSLKYQVLDMTNESMECKGLVERIGIPGSILKHTKTGMDEKLVVETPMENHKDAIGHVLEALVDEKYGVIKDMSEISAVGHRVAHGGEQFAHSVLIDDEVIAAITECIELAPLHNPANLLGIQAGEELMPNAPQVAVFDTAYHQTMPPASYIYALPYELYEDYHVRRYGFHGTSHHYVAEKTAEFLGQNFEDMKIITCHLGNGSSIAAIKEGASYDTSMGFTPSAGLPMGTRAGDVDSAIFGFIKGKMDIGDEEVNDIVYKKSGLLGISGLSSDFRDITEAAEAGNERAQLTLDVFVQAVKGFIGKYTAEMNGVDAIVFTGGIGENSIIARELICSNMEFFGIKIDTVKNDIRGEATVISADDSKVKVVLMPTNEELMIARETVEIVNA